MHKSNLFLKKQFKLQSNSDPSPKKNPKQNLQNFENKTITYFIVYFPICLQ